MRATRLHVSQLSSFGEDGRRRVYVALARRAGLPDRPALTVGSLADHDIALVRADNAGPLTLSGTNTWVVGRWVIDPGPALDAHLDTVAAVVAARGGVDGIALTHDHEDHADGRRRRCACGWARTCRSRRRGPAPRTATRSARCAPSRCRGTPTTTWRSSPAGRRSPATRCSARAASSSPATSPATSTACAACARSSSTCCAPATARRCGTWRRSSTPTSTTASTANGGSWRRSSAASAPRTTCSTRHGTTRRPSCARSPRCRSARTWRSCAPRGAPSQTGAGAVASATRRCAISIAAASGVAPVAAAWSSTVRTVSPTERTRASARSTA